MRITPLDPSAAISVHFFGHRSGADSIDGLHFLHPFRASKYYHVLCRKALIFNDFKVFPESIIRYYRVLF